MERFDEDDQGYLERGAGWVDVPTAKFSGCFGTDRNLEITGKLGDLFALAGNASGDHGRLRYLTRICKSATLGQIRVTWQQVPVQSPCPDQTISEVHHIEAHLHGALPLPVDPRTVRHWSRTEAAWRQLLSGNVLHALADTLKSSAVPIQVLCLNGEEFKEWLGALGIPSTTRVSATPGIATVTLQSQTASRPILFRQVSDTDLAAQAKDTKTRAPLTLCSLPHAARLVSRTMGTVGWEARCLTLVPDATELREIMQVERNRSYGQGF